MYCTTSKNLGWEPWRKQALKLRDLLPWGSLNHAKSMADSHDFKGQLHHQLYIKRAAKQDLHMYCALSSSGYSTISERWPSPVNIDPSWGWPAGLERLCSLATY